MAEQARSPNEIKAYRRGVLDVLSILTKVKCFDELWLAQIYAFAKHEQQTFDDFGKLFLRWVNQK